MRQPTIHQMREKKNHRGKVKEVERLQYHSMIEVDKPPSSNWVKCMDACSMNLRNLIQILMINQC
jgi:hypothetical protein